MEHTGIVIGIEGANAVVRFVRSKACTNCKMCDMVGSGEAETLIPNILEASIGDTVRVQLEAKRIAQAGVLAYVIPLIMLLAGIMIGVSINDTWGAILGILFTGIGLIIVKRLEPAIKRGGKFQPTMISKEEGNNNIGR